MSKLRAPAGSAAGRTTRHRILLPLQDPVGAQSGEESGCDIIVLGSDHVIADSGLDRAFPHCLGPRHHPHELPAHERLGGLARRLTSARAVYVFVRSHVPPDSLRRIDRGASDAAAGTAGSMAKAGF
jgi:hypothetical protein